MKKFVIKRPKADNPAIWEWKTHMPVENSTYVDLEKFDTREAAEAAASQWGQNTQIVEINTPD